MPQCKHSWRTIDGLYRDGSILQQCKKCGRTRETNIVLKIVIASLALLGAIACIAYILYG